MDVVTAGGKGTEGDGGTGHDYRHRVIDTRLRVKQNCSQRKDPGAPRDMEGLTGFVLSMKETRRLGDLKRQKKAPTSLSRTEQNRTFRIGLKLHLGVGIL